MDDEGPIPRCLDKDCGARCSSSQHAMQLINAVTKGSTLQSQLFLSRCHNASSVRDLFGRTVLHIAASCGSDQSILAPLSQDSDLNVQDFESGWTSLHRALFYGQLATARLLIALGANNCLRDYEGLTPLDLIVKDRLPHVEFLHSGLNEMFTWGINANCTLGHENVQRKFVSPECVNFFGKQGIAVKQVALSKYHTVFMSNAGQVYTCGHGLGGRLGQADDLTYLVPRFVEALKGEICTQISAARDHSVFLTESGSVFSCGLNTYGQLGQVPPTEKCLTPKAMNAKSLRGYQIIGVCARRFHTVVWSLDSVFSFGLNAGQLGHLRGEPMINQPRLVSALKQKDSTVQFVTASDAATIVLTSRGDVFALHQYQCRKIISKMLDVVQLCAFGGSLDASLGIEGLCTTGGSILTIVLLVSSGKVYVWRDKDPVVRRCRWVSPGRPLYATRVALGGNTMCIVTKDGEAFMGHIPSSKSSTIIIDSCSSVAGNSFDVRLGELVERDDILPISLTRVAQVHRATDIFVDCTGSNFAVLQAHPNACVTEIPSVRTSEMRQHMDSLFHTASIDDRVHDVILQVGTERIPTHRYVLSVRSEFFRNRLRDEPSSQMGELVVAVDVSNSTAFRRLLTFMYTDTCDLLTVGHRVVTRVHHQTDSVQNKSTNNKTKHHHHKKHPNNRSTVKENVAADSLAEEDPVTCLKVMARQFGVTSLVKRLEMVHCVNGVICVLPTGRGLPEPRISFDRNMLSEYHDAIIEAEDGNVLSCHRCILSARLDYFHGLFSSAWIETTSVSDSEKIKLKMPIPSEILKIVLDFLYTDKAIRVTDCDNVELLCNVLAIADQLLISRLKDICETSITQQLNLRNVCEVLELTDMCSANQLKASCLQFIVINLSALLELRSLDRLSDDLMDEIASYYRETIPGMCRRVITPYSGFPDYDVLEELERIYLAGSKVAADATSTPNVRKGKIRRKRTQSSAVADESMENVDDDNKPSAAPRMPEDTLLEECPNKTDVKDRSSLEVLDNDRDVPALEGISSPTCKSPISSPRVIFDPTCRRWADLAASPPAGSSLIGQHHETRESFDVKEAPGLREILAEQSTLRPNGPNASQATTQVVKSQGSRTKKLSQSDRKRMAQSLGLGGSGIGHLDAVEASKILPEEKTVLPTSPWVNVNTLVKSFKDVMLSEEVTAKQIRCHPTQMQPSFSQPSGMPLHVRSTTSQLLAKPSTTSQPPVKSATSSQSSGLPTPMSQPSVKSVSTSQPFVRSSTTSQPPVKSSNVHAATSDTVVRWGLFSFDVNAAKTSAQKNAIDVDLRGSVDLEFAAWKTSNTAVGVLATSPSASSFANIVQDELQQRETLHHTTNKPLALIQMEERAIAVLLQTYHAADNVSEYITVQRVSENVTCARPLWVTSPRH